jgi:hypothetical protein
VREAGAEARTLPFPPDPLEPPELRTDVILACGHVETMVTDLDWVFGRPPHLVTEERSREMAAELETRPVGDHARKQMCLVKARYPPSPVATLRGVRVGLIAGGLWACRLARCASEASSAAQPRRDPSRAGQAG